MEHLGPITLTRREKLAVRSFAGTKIPVLTSKVNKQLVAPKFWLPPSFHLLDNKMLAAVKICPGFAVGCDQVDLKFIGLDSRVRPLSNIPSRTFKPPTQYAKARELIGSKSAMSACKFKAVRPDPKPSPTSPVPIPDSGKGTSKRSASDALVVDDPPTPVSKKTKSGSSSVPPKNPRDIPPERGVTTISSPQPEDTASLGRITFPVPSQNRSGIIRELYPSISLQFNQRLPGWAKRPRLILKGDLPATPSF